MQTQNQNRSQSAPNKEAGGGWMGPLVVRLQLMRGYYAAARRDGHGRLKCLHAAWWITRSEWWHCSLCGTPVALHPSDKPIGCHKDGCENIGIHLLQGKGRWHSSHNAESIHPESKL
jgi:hypothetical protein